MWLLCDTEKSFWSSFPHSPTLICALLPIFSRQLQHVTLAWCHTKPADLSLKALSSIDDCLYFLPVWNCFILANPVIKAFAAFETGWFHCPTFFLGNYKVVLMSTGHSLACLRLAAQAASMHKCSPSPTAPPMAGSPTPGRFWRPQMWIIFLVNLLGEFVRKRMQEESITSKRLIKYSLCSFSWTWTERSQGFLIV